MSLKTEAEFLEQLASERVAGVAAVGEWKTLAIARHNRILELATELNKARDEVEVLRKDSERLRFVLDEEITISQMNGTGRPMVYRCQWHDCAQVDWFPSAIEAIDAAMSKEKASD